MWPEFLENSGHNFWNPHRVYGKGCAMNCEFCGGTTAKRTVKKQHWVKAKLYIVENVEAEVCTQCGERYFHAKTLDAIDRLPESDHEVSERMNVEVVTMR
jgi:YgiT-type zinc finger domain-containing protein